METLKKLVILNVLVVVFIALFVTLKNPIKRIIESSNKDSTISQENLTKNIAKDIKEDFENFWKVNDESSIDFKNLDKTDGVLKFKKNIYWAEEIKKGGYILLVRHGEREKWDESVTGFDVYELNNKIDPRDTDWYKAVCLTNRGIETMKLVKKVFEYADLKIQKVFSSPSCRAIETAIYGFGRIDEIHHSLLHLTAYHPLDYKKMARNLKNTLLNFDLEKDKLLILSAHNNVINYSDLIDQFDINDLHLGETGFFIIEKKKNKLILRHKFHQSKRFLSLMYRFNPKIKSCVDPVKVDKEKNC